MKKGARDFLLFDVGNTRMKWAISRSRRSIHLAGDIATKEVRSEWINALAQKFPDYPVVVASVVPKLKLMFRKVFSRRLIEATSALPKLGLRFDYPQPAELGADRIAAAVAVQETACYPAIIVACGTATAFTVLDAKGRLCGGVIAPGLQTQLAALLGVAAQLPATKLRSPRRVLARSTLDAIRAGVLLNFQGGVKEIIRALMTALPGKEPVIILTGGNAGRLVGKLGPVQVRPLLVLEGLRIIGNRVIGPHESDF